MTYIDTTLRNTITHRPPHSYGNCHSVCMAAIMGLSVDDVPHFFDDCDNSTHGAKAYAKIDAWVLENGWFHSTIAFPDHGLPDLMAAWRDMFQKMPLILGGKSNETSGHSVVVFDGKIVLDPTGTGIVHPLEDDHYFITVLGRRGDNWRLK